MPMHIRDAEESDIAGILAIYNEVIAHSTAIYAEQPVTLADRQAWFAGRRAQGYPVFVAADVTGIVGFASFGDFRAWPCYRYCVEHSLHIRADRRGQGIGRSLLERLILRAGDRGKHVLIAGIDADNQASVQLHRAFGFDTVAHFREVGRKFDRWLDLVFMQKILADPMAGH
jgi:L-amino acid N-acyltransferase YncA